MTAAANYRPYLEKGDVREKDMFGREDPESLSNEEEEASLSENEGGSNPA